MPANPNFGTTPGGGAFARSVGAGAPSPFAATPGMAAPIGAGQPPAAAPPQSQSGMGSYTTGVSAGPIGQGVIGQGMAAMQAPPPAMYNFLGPQFQGLMRQQGDAGAVNLSRQAAPAQASLLLGQQSADANAGIQNGQLLSRLQQDQFAAGAPQRQILNMMLQSAFGGMGT